MFKWAVIGTGKIANTVCGEIVKTNKHQIVSVYSRTKTKAETFAEKFGAKCFDDIEEFFKSDFDGVYIATPHSAHYKYLIECINHNKPVVSEKAFTVNADQTKKVFKLANEKQVFAAEAMWTRFNPAVKKVKEWIKEGKIGRVTNFKADFCIPLVLSKPFMSERVYKPEYAGGSLLDLGVYPISYAHYLFGMPKEIKVEMVVKDGIDYDEKIVFTYENGLICNLWSGFNDMKFDGEIVGETGKIRLPKFHRPTSVILENVDGKKTYRCKRGYIYEFDAFAKDIKDNKIEDSVISQKDTIEVMELMDEVRKQGGLKYPKQIEEL